MMKKILLYCIVAVLFFAGFLLVFYPMGKSAAAEQEGRDAIRRFQETAEEEQKAEEETNLAGEDGDGEDSGADDRRQTDDGEGSGDFYAQLFQDMEEYNQKIYKEQQTSLCDAWSYQQNVFDFPAAGLKDDMVGYLTIDAMGVELPLYIGASEENMSKGAVVLGQTSMPIGGENTNCVIAAHRGWYTSPMFQDIEVLEVGDEVRLTNLWGTLTYQVVKCIVIDPADIDAVKIIEGEDLLTLITCHPYTKNYQRYVVYCSRTGGANNLDQTKETGQEEGETGSEEDTVSQDPAQVVIPFEGVAWESSQREILRERTVNRLTVPALGLLLAALILIIIIRLLKRKRKN